MAPGYCRKELRLGGHSLLLSIILASLALPAEGAVGPASVPRDEVYEAVLTSSKTYPNPFLDVTVSATFTSPSGKKIAAYGFYDGGNTWRVRFAPDEKGRWQYLTSSTDAGNDGLQHQRGSLTSVSSGNKGFIRPEPAHPCYFSFSNGSPFFPLDTLRCFPLFRLLKCLPLDSRPGIRTVSRGRVWLRTSG
jgi:Domain of unknown function (DUF5060)